MQSEPSALRDFTVDRRVWLLSGVSIGIGVCATALAVLLLRCIALATNLFYYHQLSTVGVSPAPVVFQSAFISTGGSSAVASMTGLSGLPQGGVDGVAERREAEGFEEAVHRPPLY